MANKNNFSKAVLDLMGLPGNEAAPGIETQDSAAEAGFGQNIKAEFTIRNEAEKESDLDLEHRQFLQNQKTVGSAPIQEDNPSTVISLSMVIVGEITSRGDIDIYGDVKGSVKTDGNIKATGTILGDLSGNSFALNGCTVQGNIAASGNVVIGQNTVVVGDITAENIKVNGKVKGNLVIGKMSEFMENALLAGDVCSQTISISQGAKLHGNVSVSLDSSQSEKEFDSIFGM